MKTKETYLKRVNDHDIYRHCLKLAKAILRRGNIKNQQIYVHVAEKNTGKPNYYGFINSRVEIVAH